MKIIQRPTCMPEIFEHKGGAEPDATHYCPGCGHGILHKLLAECIDELDIQNRTILISPVGCAVFAYYYFEVGNVQAAHGRAPAVGTGIKRARPDSIVVSYQGDGDLAAIGGNNVLQAANRGENVTVIFVNNAIYGMTGGQLAPTSLLGMKTATTPHGREFTEYGSPMRVAELLAQLDGVAYSTRCSLTNASRINKTKRAIKKALRYQMENKGFSLVEVLSQCPTGWKMDPVESLSWVDEEMGKVFPLGVFKDSPHDERLEPLRPADYDAQHVEKVVNAGIPPAKTIAEADEIPWSGVFGGSGREVPTLRLKASGFGGQGVLLSGELLAKAAMRGGIHVTWLPSYGPEMRGGTANCSVVASIQEIGNPLVTDMEILLAMNRPSMERFEGDLVAGGLLLYDSSLIDTPPNRTDIEVIGVPATKIADDLGMGKVANVVMLGALLQRLGFPQREQLEDAIREISKTDEIFALNRKALTAGMEEIRSQSTTPQI